MTCTIAIFSLEKPKNCLNVAYLIYGGRIQCKICTCNPRRFVHNVKTRKKVIPINKKANINVLTPHLVLFIYTLFGAQIHVT